MDHEDYVEAAERDRELRFTPEKRKVAAQKKAWYEANREKVAAQQKAYREAHREKIAAQKKAYHEANREKAAAQQRAYYEANREKVIARQRAYREANREKLAEKQRVIRETRIAVGLSQEAAANILGVSQAMISFWERGLVRCDAAAVVQALQLRADYGRDAI